MLTFAASMEGRDEDVARAMHDPHLRDYVEGFGRKGDLGVVALLGEAPVGAAWLRLLEGEPHPMMVWTHEVPEIAIAIDPSVRGRGVGSLLLGSLLDAAAGSYPSIVLSVREGNPAVRLYERFGFVDEGRLGNRVGGMSVVMRRPSPTPRAPR
jgi:ribosomal protein S18 acetylase RimI-like enzyme